MILLSLIMVLSLARLVWDNVEVTSHTHWLTEILLLAGVVSLLTAVLLLAWFYLVPRITRRHQDYRYARDDQDLLVGVGRKGIEFTPACQEIMESRIKDRVIRHWASAVSHC